MCGVVDGKLVSVRVHVNYAGCVVVLRSIATDDDVMAWLHVRYAEIRVHWVAAAGCGSLTRSVAPRVRCILKDQPSLERRVCFSRPGKVLGQTPHVYDR